MKRHIFDFVLARNIGLITFIEEHLRSLIIILLLLILLPVILTPNCGDKKSTKNYRPSKKTKVIYTIPFNLIVRGNGKLKVEVNNRDDEYDIKGIRDFELNPVECTELKIWWKSNDDKEMEIYISGGNIKKTDKKIKSKTGELIFNIGERSPCFINSI